MKPKEAIIVHLDQKTPLNEQVGRPIMINHGKQSLSEGYFFVEHPEHAPDVYRVVNGVRKATGLCLVPKEDGGWTVHYKNLTDSLKGLAHLI